MPLRVFLPQGARRLHNVSYFARRAFFIIHTTIGKASESAVGIEKHLFGTVVFESPFGVPNDGLNAFCLFGPRIHNTQPDFTIGKCLPHNIHIACSRCSIFQNKLLHSYFAEAGNQRFVISGQEHFFGAAPVAAANMEAGAHSGNPFDYTVQQFCGIG